jgi:hypothetical protein
MPLLLQFLSCSLVSQCDSDNLQHFTIHVHLYVLLASLWRPSIRESSACPLCHSHVRHFNLVSPDYFPSCWYIGHGCICSELARAGVAFDLTSCERISLNSQMHNAFSALWAQTKKKVASPHLAGPSEVSRPLQLLNNIVLTFLEPSQWDHARTVFSRSMRVKR